MSCQTRTESVADTDVAAALSKRLGLPIKWIEDRSEAFLATVHGRDLIAYVELAATREGKVLGLRMGITADIGAYTCCSPRACRRTA